MSRNEPCLVEKEEAFRTSGVTEEARRKIAEPPKQQKNEKETERKVFDIEQAIWMRAECEELTNEETDEEKDPLSWRLSW